MRSPEVRLEFDMLIFGVCADFKAVEAVVDATHRYKEIFYDGNE